jgi:hypothetical protein
VSPGAGVDELVRDRGLSLAAYPEAEIDGFVRDAVERWPEDEPKLLDAAPDRVRAVPREDLLETILPHEIVIIEVGGQVWSSRMLVSLVDEVPGEPREARGTVTVLMPTITVRELIRARVELELERLQDDAADRCSARWLVMPGARARSPDGQKPPVPPDIEAMVRVALTGFERGRFFILVNDRQVTVLDEPVPLRDATEVTLLLLVPLQGG